MAHAVKTKKVPTSYLRRNIYIYSKFCVKMICFENGFKTRTDYLISRAMKNLFSEGPARVGTDYSFYGYGTVGTESWYAGTVSWQWYGTVGTYCTYRTVLMVPTVPYPPCPPYRTPKIACCSKQVARYSKLLAIVSSLLAIANNFEGSTVPTVPYHRTQCTVPPYPPYLTTVPTVPYRRTQPTAPFTVPSFLRTVPFRRALLLKLDNAQILCFKL